ncbi:hypothetical protein [Variovorax guangxiensis]|uniref:hypothetical protein n=1 Tax=Variovorax guangxiensis TaxID=1775474 RepID=UPI00285D9F96|nr:hypothetical protein [Variovorax guangxiensis]MDR6860535.1 hypothetical protein [Variovorax guangxiensis]
MQKESLDLIGVDMEEEGYIVDDWVGGGGTLIGLWEDQPWRGRARALPQAVP